MAADAKGKSSNKKRKKNGKKRTPFRETPWFQLVWVTPVLILVLGIGVVLSRWFLGSGSGQEFLRNYSGHSNLPEGAPEGFPWWMQWQHFFNFFLITLIIRSGWLVRTQQKPEAYWTRNNSGRLKTKNPPTKMSLYAWLHLSLDVLWVLNGLVFLILLFSTGQWVRVVPTGWDIFPNAISTGLQYLSLDWPLETAWTNYNAMQVLAYFVTIFIAAPLAALTGIRISPMWSNGWKISRYYPTPLARVSHLLVMFYFVLFIFVHVLLVFTTGMRHNLNYMFSSQPEGSDSWWGFIIFSISLIVVAAGWILARPIFMSPAAQLTGKVTSR